MPRSGRPSLLVFRSKACVQRVCKRRELAGSGRRETRLGRPLRSLTGERKTFSVVGPVRRTGTLSGRPDFDQDPFLRGSRRHVPPPIHPKRSWGVGGEWATRGRGPGKGPDQWSTTEIRVGKDAAHTHPHPTSSLIRFNPSRTRTCFL